MPSFVSHPLLVPETIRRQDQQLQIAVSALKESSLVVAPTGTGKTVMALLAMLPTLERGGTVLFLAPTRPLVRQHRDFLRSVLIPHGPVVAAIDGAENPASRRDTFIVARGFEGAVIVATPQTIDNDLQAGRYTLQDVAMIVYDEAHHATGEYAYCHVAEAYRVQGPQDRRALGITASPGHLEEDIKAVCGALDLSQVLTAEAELNISEEVITLDMPADQAKAAETLHQMIERHEWELRQVLPFGTMIRGRKVNVSNRGDLVALMDRAAQETRRGLSYEEKAPWFKVMSAAAALLKLHHAVILAESQGIEVLRAYLTGLQSDSSKAGKRIASDPQIRAIIRLDPMGRDPKYLSVLRLLRGLPKGSKALVFCTYRDSVNELVQTINTTSEKWVAPFIGQAPARGSKERGMSQKAQAQTIAEFRAGNIDALVCTCIGEEGIDIPSVDLVVFYEPTPSAIRDIQRRGRTGRFGAAGRVVVLMYRGGVDEGYYHSARRKKEEMQTTLSARCS